MTASLSVGFPIPMMRVSGTHGVFGREIALDFAREFGASAGSFFRRTEKANIIHDAVFIDLGSPKSPLGIKADTDKAGLIVALERLVGAVPAAIGAAKIINPVVVSIAIAVIKKSRGIFAMEMKPCDAVGGISHTAINLDHSITGWVDCASHGSCVPAVPFNGSFAAWPPRKNAGRWVVVQKPSDKFNRQIISNSIWHLLCSVMKRAKPIMAAIAAQPLVMER